MKNDEDYFIHTHTNDEFVECVCVSLMRFIAVIFLLTKDDEKTKYSRRYDRKGRTKKIAFFVHHLQNTSSSTYTLTHSTAIT